ncbi:S8 family serine peptidase [Desulfonema magnum]|uniref:Peptidase S8/S53 domain-containing protein n=1 Tax=Desulfonema magnum TaxID=45655 RepID=A0A975BJ01_9BACT|nr:S8 family serine peptidase [Desulfonema magnum]QTA86210.1 Peptidase S8/S53 domain-containing protein [Desulfonema magnum]
MKKFFESIGLAKLALAMVMTVMFQFTGEAAARETIFIDGKECAKGEVIVELDISAADPDDLRALKKELGVENVIDLQNADARLIWGSPSWRTQLWLLTGSVSYATGVTRPYISYIEPNYRIYSIDADPNRWGLNNTGQTGGTADADIDAPEAWAFAEGKMLKDVIVAVIDSGVDYMHPVLKDKMWENPKPGDKNDVHGYNFVSDDGDPSDDLGHGTHVAGTIVSVCPSAKIMALKFMDADGFGFTSDAIRALYYAMEKGAKIVNNSWEGRDSQALRKVMTKAQQRGKLMVAGAGNSGSDNDAAPHYPSGYDLDNIISVAATDHNDDLAVFSNYGAGSVDLAAPGEKIYSTMPGGGFEYKDGTSMAAAHVSGVAALVWALEPEMRYSQVKQRLRYSVDPVSVLDEKVVMDGRLNAYKSLRDFTSIPMTFDNWNKLNSGNWEETAEGIKIYGSAYRGCGTFIHSETIYNFKDSETLIKWKPDSTRYACFAVRLHDVVTTYPFTTHHSWSGSIVVSSDVWYYSRIKVNSDKTYVMVTSEDDYDISGGNVIRWDAGTLSDEAWNTAKKTSLRAGFFDNYQGTGVYMIIGEVKTNAVPVEIEWTDSAFYNFESSSEIPPEFGFEDGWAIDDSGYESSKALYMFANQSSSLTLDATDAVLISFRAKYSAASEYDYFRFSIDGRSATGISRTGVWSDTLTFVVPDGAKTFEWRYSEDTRYSGQSNGSSVWIDDIEIKWNTGDSDGDGLPDAWEQKYFGDIITSDGTGDYDNDGLTDSQEYSLGTDPTNTDTDDDGWTDFQEYKMFTDPNDPNDHPNPPLDPGVIEVCSGVTVSVPLVLSNVENIGIEGVDVKVKFDENVLVATGATLSGSVLEGKGYEITSQVRDGGEITATVFANGDLFPGSGIVMNLEFYVVGELGDTAELTLARAKLNESDISAEVGSVEVVECPPYYEISGTVRYYSDDALISNVLMELDGAKSDSVTTGTEGEYSFSVSREPADYTVTAYKNDHFGGLGGVDASRIARYAAGFSDVEFDCYQMVAADVNGDGEITGLDASRVARYVAGKINYLNEEDTHWVFVPTPDTPTMAGICHDWPPIAYTSERTYSPLNSDKTGQDFMAVRLGDVTGNWSDEPVRTKRRARSGCEAEAVPGSVLTIPVVLSQDMAIEGIDIKLTYDADVLELTGATLAGGILEYEGYALLTGTEDGEATLVISAADRTFTGSGETVFLSFDVIGKSGNTSAVSLTKFECNEEAAVGGFQLRDRVCQEIRLNVDDGGSDNVTH